MRTQAEPGTGRDNKSIERDWTRVPRFSSCDVPMEAWTFLAPDGEAAAVVSAIHGDGGPGWIWIADEGDCVWQGIELDRVDAMAAAMTTIAHHLSAHQRLAARCR